MAEYSFLAGGTIYSSRFCKLSTAADSTVLQATAGDFVQGISEEWSNSAPIPNATSESALAGDSIKVYQIGDICYLKCGTASITRGSKLKSDANGLAVAATTGDYYGAVAFESMASGELGRVQVLIGTL